MITTMMLLTVRWIFVMTAGLAFALVLACGEDELGSAGTDGTVTPEPVTRAPRDPFGSPLEGPPREPVPEELTDFREDPDWRLPDPESQPAPPLGGESDVVLDPPADPSCPEDWELVRRGAAEGFSICYPDNWEEATNTYVNAPNEERWYSIGFFIFQGDDREHQLAHVSVYVFPQYSRPVRYTLDCPLSFRVTFAGEPSVICPNFPPVEPEARIISYHVFWENRDYFVNVAAYLEYDEEKGEYRDSFNEEALNQAIEIAHTFQFAPLASGQ